MNKLFLMVLLTLGALGWSCSESDLRSKSNSVSTDASSSATSETNQDESADAQASEPVMTAGAFLSCSIDASQASDDQTSVQCHITDAEQNALIIDRANELRFTVTPVIEGAAPIEITPTVTTTDGVTRWSIVLPEVEGRFVIAAIFPDGRRLETIVESTNNPGGNTDDDAPNPDPAETEVFTLGPQIFQNSSFSQPAINNPDFSDQQKGWSHVNSNNVPGWQAEWNNNTCLNQVRIEIQKQNQATEQWVDMAGSCEVGVTPPPGGSNLRLIQTVNSTPEARYQLSFRYRLQNSQTNVLQVLGPAGQVLFDSSTKTGVSENVWNSISFEFTATESTTNLVFQETGTDPLTGTNIDDVSLREYQRQMNSEP